MRFFLVGCAVLAAACSSPAPNGADAGPDAAAPDAAGSDASTDTGTGSDSGACGNASATVNGTMLGVTLSAKDATYLPGSEYFLVVGDFSGLCALGNDLKANSNVLVFDFYGTAPKPGTIQVGGNSLDVQFAEYDATCNSPAGESANAGSVTITKADACGVEGTFDVTMNSDHVTGSFTAPTCSFQSDGGASSCK